jgi:hypothetical protein
MFKARGRTRTVVLNKKVARGWRRLHSEELHNLYVSGNIITEMKSTMINGLYMHNAGRYDKCKQNFNPKTWKVENTWDVQAKREG